MIRKTGWNSYHGFYNKLSTYTLPDPVYKYEQVNTNKWICNGKEQYAFLEFIFVVTLGTAPFVHSINSKVSKSKKEAKRAAIKSWFKKYPYHRNNRYPKHYIVLLFPHRILYRWLIEPYYCNAITFPFRPSDSLKAHRKTTESWGLIGALSFLHFILIYCISDLQNTDG